MSPFFGKKQIVLALAEVLEDGRALAAREMQKPKYRDYAGAEPMLEIAVRVQPVDGVAFEAKMKAGLSKTYLLVPGVRASQIRVGQAAARGAGR